MRLEPAGRSLTGRPKGRFKDVMKEDMKLLGVKVQDPEDRTKWRQGILSPDGGDCLHLIESKILHIGKSG